MDIIRSLLGFSADVEKKGLPRVIPRAAYLARLIDGTLVTLYHGSAMVERHFRGIAILGVEPTLRTQLAGFSVDVAGTVDPRRALEFGDNDRVHAYKARIWAGLATTSPVERILLVHREEAPRVQRLRVSPCGSGGRYRQAQRDSELGTWSATVPLVAGT